VSVSIACSPAGLELLRSRWERLYSPEQHTIFQSFAWNRLAAAVFRDRETPYVVHAENSTGAALIPAAIAGGRITLLGETLFDYRDVLVVGDGQALRTAWRELARLRLPLKIPAVRGGSRWSGFDLQPFSQAPYLRTKDTGQLAAHSRAGRLVRRLERKAAELKHYDGSAAELLRDIYHRKAAQSGGNLFADRRRVEFILQALALAPAAVDVFTFETANALIAALVTLRDGRFRRFYTTWFDRAWAHDSPGTALLFEVTRQSLAEGLNCDYMTGTQPQKQRFATSSVSLFRVEASAEQLARIAGEAAPVEAAA
jgi:CelD/BcsL family acetyltransferase involved in cellulose biosynthesis